MKILKAFITGTALGIGYKYALIITLNGMTAWFV